MRDRYVKWESMARDCVAYLRMEAARNLGEPGLAALVGHPVAGDLTLDWENLTSGADHDQQLVIWTAEPGSPSHDALRILASWALTHAQGQRHTAEN
jgi:hypothetical protein